MNLEEKCEKAVFLLFHKLAQKIYEQVDVGEQLRWAGTMCGLIKGATNYEGFNGKWSFMFDSMFNSSHPSSARDTAERFRIHIDEEWENYIEVTSQLALDAKEEAGL